MKAIAKVLIIMLEARLAEAMDYPYNSSMHIECKLLRAEIKALKKILKKGGLK